MKIMKITIMFKDESLTVFEVPDYKITEFFENAYPLIFDRIETLEMTTIKTERRQDERKIKRIY